jgi:2-C-methyl-D-erythritol 4-phosphate cytidylyltransferase/2-C-methyl-D-erythritol 2,4-cyclodiphosphate synthase
VVAEDAFNLEIDGRPVFDHVKASLSGIPGVTRVEVLRGSWLKTLRSIEAGDFDRVIFHAADRPFFSSKQLTELLMQALSHRVAVPGLPVTDTYKVIRAGRIESTPTRERLVSLQAPWFFARSALEQLPTVQPADATTMSGLCRIHGLDVAILPGHPANIRVRSEADIHVIRWAWQQAA